MKASVVSWVTEDYVIHQNGIRSDCERLGYDFHSKLVDKKISRIAEAWTYKAYFIRECLEKFEKIIYVDSEVRILRPLPEQWLASSFLLSKFSPIISNNLLLPYHSAFILMDRTAIPVVDAWIRVMERWNLAGASDEQLNRWDLGNSAFITDETALYAAISALGIFPNTFSVGWRPPPNIGKEEMRLGAIYNSHTVLLHSFLQHWGQDKFSWGEYEYYRMFRMHYSDDQYEVAEKMERSDEVFEKCGWHFDCKQKLYAPTHFLNRKAAQWQNQKQKSWDTGF